TAVGETAPRLERIVAREELARPSELTFVVRRLSLQEVVRLAVAPETERERERGSPGARLPLRRRRAAPVVVRRDHRNSDDPHCGRAGEHDERHDTTAS